MLNSKNWLTVGRWDKWRARCSSLYTIVGEGRGTTITPTQLKELEELLNKIKLTDKQAERRDELIAKRDAEPDLSAGAKTELEKIWKEITFGRRKEHSSKQTEKGTLTEEMVLRMADVVYNWDLPEEFWGSEKERIKNDLIEGEPDVDWSVLADAKSSWDIHTFPMFDDKIDPRYWWQLQGYMHLTGHLEAELVYGLVDTPEHLILDAIRKREWLDGVFEIDPEVEESIRRAMTFADLPIEMRLRRFIIQRDSEALKTITVKIPLARKYLNELDERFERNFNVNLNDLNREI